MEMETFKEVGTGAGGAIAGVLATYAAFKSKFRNIVYKDTFEAVVKGMETQLTTMNDTLKEQGKDIKKLLQK